MLKVSYNISGELGTWGPRTAGQIGTKTNRVGVLFQNALEIMCVLQSMMELQHFHSVNLQEPSKGLS